VRFGAFALVLLAPLATASVAPAPSMQVPRAAHAATLLSDGRVLVTGGCTASSCETDARSATTELYSPASARFAPGPRLLRPRVGHAAVTLPNGDVLVFGGWIGPQETATSERYVASAGRFVAAAPMRAARGGFAAVTLRDGRILVTGGYRNRAALASAELFDPRTGRWRATGSMRFARNAHTATLLADGRVLVAGGAATGGRVLASAELYTPRTGRFTSAGRMTLPRYKHGAVRLRDGRVLVLGGSNERDWRGRYASAEIFDPARRTFAATAGMHETRFKLSDAVVRLEDGSALVAGGAATVERYSGGQFRTAGGVGTELFFSTATLLRDGTVLIAGGYDGSIEPTARAWVFRQG
jgi:Kelch motif protein